MPNWTDDEGRSHFERDGKPSFLDRDPYLRFRTLSPREKQIFELVSCENLTSKGIARLLNLSPKTIDHHRAKIARKLGTHLITDWTVIAVREGLRDLSVQIEARD